MAAGVELLAAFSVGPETRPGRVIEEICRNVRIVEIDGNREYEITWGAGPADVTRAGLRRGKPAVCHFDNIGDVIRQHRHVLEGYLGITIGLIDGRQLQISGETQRMSQISAEISSLTQQVLVPLTPDGAATLEREAVRIMSSIGVVSNAYKQRAQERLGRMLSVEGTSEKAEVVLEANLAILKRTQESLDIVKGTANRLETIVRRRNQWEDTITKTFYGMAEIAKDLEGGKYKEFKAREQLARHISGESEFSLVGRLNGIAGPEYWRRIQSREVQAVRKIGDGLRENKDEEAKRLLTGAIFVLEKVVQDKQERERAKTR